MDCQPILSCWGKGKREKIENYAAYVGEGTRKRLESPFDDIVEQSILGSESFVDRIKREYLLRRSSNSGEEPALVHFQQSYSLDEVIDHVAEFYAVERESILRRKSANRDARRLAMYCAYIYCRHDSSLTDLARWFSVTVGGLTHARDKVSKDSDRKLKKAVSEIKRMIAKSGQE